MIDLLAIISVIPQATKQNEAINSVGGCIIEFVEFENKNFFIRLLSKIIPNKPAHHLRKELKFVIRFLVKKINVMELKVVELPHESEGSMLNISMIPRILSSVFQKSI